MASVSSNPITSLNQDWSNDPLTGKPFSGASVQKFIKDYLGVISRASYFDSTTNTLYWFASDEDKQHFISDPTQLELVLFSTTMSFASELYRILLTNNNNTTSINIATNEQTLYLSIDFQVQTKSMTDTHWQPTGQGVYVTVQVDNGATGIYDTVLEHTFCPADNTFIFDVRNYLETGVNRVKVNFASEQDSSVVTSIIYTISMTEMFIEPLANQWYIPIVETGDPSNYKLGGFRIIGAVSKILNIDIYNQDTLLLHFTKNIGTTAYDTIPCYFGKISDGFDLSSLQNSGVYTVSAYLTSGSITSPPINYNIIYIAEGDENSAQLVAVNDPASIVYNYTTSTLFKYCIYNKGTSSGSPAIRVKQIFETNPTITVDTVIEDVPTATELQYDVDVEWATYDTVNLFIQGEITYGNEQIVRAVLDNSVTFPPIYGYDFYLNAASRSNADENKLKIVNVADKTELSPTWNRMVWINDIDGWTVDDTGRKCLSIPAKSYMTLPYSEYKILSGNNISVELCYKVSNVADYDEVIISLVDTLESLGFNGIKIKPTNILVHSQDDTSDTNDLSRGTNVIDEQVIHFVLTIYQNYKDNNGKNLVTGYINGCKNFQFSVSNSALFDYSNDLVIGSNKSDIFLYFIRVYKTVLSEAQVEANYINSMEQLSQRIDLSNLLYSIVDDSHTFINFENVKNNNYNYFVIEMLGDGASVPSLANGWSKDQKGYSNLEMHFGQNPSWDWRIENVETSGQGTTSMNYYRWNLRWRIDKSTGKQVTAQYLESRSNSAKTNSYQYIWQNPINTKQIYFDGQGNHPALKRMTAKINMASSMQSHKIGATRAYTDLHDAIGLSNDAQEYAIEYDLPKPTVSVYEYPAFGFQKIGDEYIFIGLFTIGPDKGDKATFGFDISDDIKNQLITLEGTDHVRKMVMFNYPWNSDVQYLSGNECLNIVKDINDYDNGWEVGNCHGLSTDDLEDELSINDVLVDEFKPAYDIVYENSTLITGIPLGWQNHGNTAEDILQWINDNVYTFQSQLDSNERMSYQNYQFWIEGEYILYYYDIKDNTYKSGQNLITQHGAPPEGSVDEQNEWFKEQRRLNFKAQAEDYWDIQDALFHFCFIVIFGAIDNFGKNTYPYKMKTLANGGRWKWRQDDLDSILGIGNTGTDNMPSWIEFQDSINGAPYFGGSNSVFWNLIYECYYNNYVSTVDGSTKPGLISVGGEILDEMSFLGGGVNKYDGLTKFMQAYFWNNAQNYFPQSAYNADAQFKYEDAWLDGRQSVPPLNQSLGNHLLAEQYWTKKRVIYMMSYFKVGPFGDYSDASLGQTDISRPQSLESVTLTPNTWLYPVLITGQGGSASTSRTRPNEQCVFTNLSTGGETNYYINASDLLSDFGDLKDLLLGQSYIIALNVKGKKLINFKIGDENPEKIVTDAVYYTQQECDDYNTENNLSPGDEGYLTTDVIKTPAVTTPNITTNVSGLEFTNTSCLEKIDARNASSIGGEVDLSQCPRINEAYFDGTDVTSVTIKNGAKIERLSLSDSTTSISLRNLRLLTEQHLQLPSDLSKIESFQIQKCDFDVLDMLYNIYMTEDSSLRYFNIAMYQDKSVNADYLSFLINIKNGKNKDGEDVENGYHGINDSGTPLPGQNPKIEGTLILSSGYYQEDMEELGLTNVESYPLDQTKRIGLIPFFSSLYIVYDPNTQYIRFADAAVRDVCIANFSTDGIGVTLIDAQNRNCNSLFTNNTNIKTFEEFRYFTGVTSMRSMFQGSSVRKVTLPQGIILTGNTGGIQAYYLFYGCSSLQEIDFADMTRSSNSANTETRMFFNCTALTKLHYANVGQIINLIRDTSSRTDYEIPFGYNSSTHYVYVNGEELRNVIIPDTITKIRAASFFRFNRIRSVDIPSSVTTIGASAFYLCSQLATVIIRKTTPPTLSNTDAFSSNASGRKFYVPYSADHSILDAYKGASNWSSYASVIFELDEDGNIPTN